MKKQIFLVGIFLITAISFGQKKEIKKAGNALESGDVAEAITYLNEAEPMLADADSEIKAQYYLYKGMSLTKNADTDLKKAEMAVEAFSKAKEFDTKDIKSELDLGIQQLSQLLVNSAVDDQKAEKFESASKKLYKGYMLNKQDTSYLYYAAANSLNNKDYDTALKYYKELLDLGYTGKSTQYIAVDVETREEEAFESVKMRDLSVKSGQYTNPSVKKNPSQKGEILRYVTLIYSNQGNDKEAMKVMAAARMENPDDVSLVQAEAEMAYKMGDLKKYNELMQIVAASDPTNPDLYFNLGAASTELKDYKSAMKYYKQALEIDPNYSAAQINIASLLLMDEQPLIDEMNNLGTSSADNKRYDVLKQKRKDLYFSVADILEPVYKTDPNNTEIVTTLMNIYAQTGNEAKLKEMKDKMKELEGN